MKKWSSTQTTSSKAQSVAENRAGTLADKEKFMSRTVTKIALIGAGTMAEYHLLGFRDAGADVVGLVDSDPEKGRNFASKWNIAGGCYPTLDALLKMHPEVQAVSVITPNKFHHPLVMEALNRNLHVFCEKPPALNAAQMREMADCAKKNRKILMFNLNNRARLDSCHIKELIHAGEVGRINSAQATWMRRTGIPGFGGWFTTKSISGGGPLIDLLHMIDLALWFMDYPDPEYVLAQTFDDFIHNPEFQGTWGGIVSNKGTTDVESACHGFVRFKTGQVLTIHNSWAELVKEEDTYVALQGTKLGVKIRSVNNQNSCELYAQNHGVSSDKNLRFLHDHDMGRTHAPKNFILALNGEEQPLTDAEEAVKLMNLIDAVYLSASSGKPVRILKNGYETL